MKLAELIKEELQKIEWEQLMGDGSSSGANRNGFVVDMRQWTQMAITNAIYTFVTNQYEIDAIANGVFLNTTNFTPSTYPILTPTTGVELTTEPPKFKSQKDLYDIIVDFTTSLEGNDYSHMIDTFQRIFVDWLGVLEVGCGQDTDVDLPIVPSGSSNVAPPFFHSIDGGTKATAHFKYPQTEYSKYPNSDEVGDDDSDEEKSELDKKVFDAVIKEFDERLEVIQELMDTAYDLLPSAPYSDDAEKETRVDEWLINPYELHDTIIANNEVIAKVQLKELNDDASNDDLELKNTLISENDAISDTISKIEDDMNETEDDVNDDEVYVEHHDTASIQARIDIYLFRLDEIELQKQEFIDGELGLVEPPSAPEKEDVGTTDKDAPDMNTGRLQAPVPYKWIYPTTSIFPTIQVPMFFTFPTFTKNAKACKDELWEVSESGEMSFEVSWDITAKYILKTLNENVIQVGGGSGYCYGSPSNLWSGVVVAKLKWSE